MNGYDCDFCDCGKRDEEGRLRKGLHIEPFRFRGKEILITINVVSENPRIENATVPGSAYGRMKNTVFVYTQEGNQESLECHNSGGMHTRSVNYWANQLYWLKPTKIIPPETK